MVGFFSQIKERFGGTFSTEADEEPEEIIDEYVELAPDSVARGQEKIQVRPFIIEDFEDIRPILDSLREGYCIAVIDIKPIKTKDVIELKRSVAKIKKTVDALKGSIAGFGEHTIIATPEFAEIHKVPPAVKKDKADFLH